VTARFQPSQQSVCEGTRKTLDILAQWYQWFDRHSDLIMPVRQTPDIAAAKAAAAPASSWAFKMPRQSR
jgi:hypothetical protein